MGIVKRQTSGKQKNELVEMGAEPAAQKGRREESERSAGTSKIGVDVKEKSKMSRERPVKTLYTSL